MQFKTQKKLIGLAASLLILGTTMFSSDVVTNASIWNWSRGFLVLGSGTTALALISGLFIGDLIWKASVGKPAKILIAVLFSPIFLVGLFIVFGMSMCTFTGRARDGAMDEVNVANSRIYIDYIGDQGALGASGLGVFQEKPLFGPFYRRKELCSVFSPTAPLSFKVLNSESISCMENGEERVVPLAL